MNDSLQKATDDLDNAGKDRRKLQIKLEQTENEQTRSLLTSEIQTLNTQIDALREVYEAAVDDDEQQRRDERKQREEAEAVHQQKAKSALYDLEVRMYNQDQARKKHEAEVLEKARAIAEEKAKKERDREVQRQLRELELAEKLEALRRKSPTA